MELEMKFRELASYHDGPVIISAVVLKKEPLDNEGLVVQLAAGIAFTVAKILVGQVPERSMFFQLLAGKMGSDLGIQVKKAVIDRADAHDEDAVWYGASCSIEKDGRLFTYQTHDPMEIIALAIVADIPLHVEQMIYETYKQELPQDDAADHTSVTGKLPWVV